jgi:hypothetical protein
MQHQMDAVQALLRYGGKSYGKPICNFSRAQTDALDVVRPSGNKDI